MKKAIFFLAFITGTSAYSQSVADTLHSTRFKAIATNLKPMNIDFSYYGKNYDKVFGEYNFTRDANNFGMRNVYVGYNDTFYYQSSSTFIMEMPNAIHNLNFSGGQDVIGGLKNLASLLKFEKDYSVKQP